MVYPDGLNEVWATGFNQTTPVEQDMQFIHDLLEHVRGEYCIDNNRLYATGYVPMSIPDSSPTSHNKHLTKHAHIAFPTAAALSTV